MPIVQIAMLGTIGGYQSNAMTIVIWPIPSGPDHPKPNRYFGVCQESP